MSKVFSSAEVDPSAREYFDDGSTTVLGLAFLEGQNPPDDEPCEFLLSVDKEGAFVRFDSDCPIGLCYEKAEAEILSMLADEIEVLKGRLLLRLAKEKREGTSLIIYDNTEFWVSKMSMGQFIDEFGTKAATREGIRNEYEYDENEQVIYRWMSGKKVVVSPVCDPLEALEMLYTWTEEDCNCRGVYSFENYKDAIDLLEWDIREFPDDPKSVRIYRTMIEEIKELAE